MRAATYKDDINAVKNRPEGNAHVGADDGREKHNQSAHTTEKCGLKVRKPKGSDDRLSLNR